MWQHSLKQRNEEGEDVYHLHFEASMFKDNSCMFLAAQRKAQLLVYPSLACAYNMGDHYHCALFFFVNL